MLYKLQYNMFPIGHLLSVGTISFLDLSSLLGKHASRMSRYDMWRKARFSDSQADLCDQALVQARAWPRPTQHWFLWVLKGVKRQFDLNSSALTLWPWLSTASGQPVSITLSVHVNHQYLFYFWLSQVDTILTSSLPNCIPTVLILSTSLRCYPIRSDVGSPVRTWAEM